MNGCCGERRSSRRWRPSGRLCPLPRICEAIEPRLLFSAAHDLHIPRSGALTPAAIIIAPVDVVDGTPGNDTITLRRNSNPTYDDWTISGNPVTYQVVVNDPNGLTINGLGGNDVINLDYTSGNPLPNIVHFNGTFTVNGLSGASPFANTLLEVGQSTVYFGYTPGSSPAAAVAAGLSAGFNGGAWNGSAASSSGAITSAAAAGGPAGVFGVGWADSTDGVVVGQPTNTVELRYTAMGDANLDGVVNSVDAIQLNRNYLIPGRTNWDQGNFNYDTAVNFSDAQILQKNYTGVASGTALPAGVTAATSGDTAPGPDGVDLPDLKVSHKFRHGRDGRGRGWRS